MGTELNVKEAYKLMLLRANKSIAGISRELELGTPANLSQMINNESLKLKIGANVANVCGYKLMLVPDDYEIEDAIEIKGEVDNE